MHTARQVARRVGGLDPGLATGALVVIDRGDRERVLACYSLVEKRGARAHALARAKELTESFKGTGTKGWGDVEFLSAELRAKVWADRFFAAFDECETNGYPIDILAMESFVDLKQNANKMMKNRWMTPLIMGLLIEGLSNREITVESGRLVYQGSGVVLPQLKVERARLKARVKADRDLIVPGDRLVTTDHERSALSHALALSQRLPHISSITTAV